MYNYYVYDRHTGVILHWGSNPDPIKNIILKENEVLKLGAVSGNGYMVNINSGKLEKLQTRPGINYVLDPIKKIWVTTNSYKDNRRTEFPSVQEQLDMLYHAMKKGEIPIATEWFNTIQEVKDKYPKEINNG